MRERINFGNCQVINDFGTCNLIKHLQSVNGRPISALFQQMMVFGNAAQKKKDIHKNVTIFYFILFLLLYINGAFIAVMYTLHILTFIAQFFFFLSYLLSRLFLYIFIFYFVLVSIIVFSC